MRHFPYPTYLRTHRKRWGLTQGELAALLGIGSSTAVAKYERLARRPSLSALVASEFIFGEHARRLFPALYASIEAGVTARAALLAEGLAGVETPEARVKRELLEAIAERAAGELPHV